MDARAFARGVAPAALMDRAAGHVARAVLRAGGRRYGLRVAIACGKGNNGGDGLAAGRKLLRAGASPVCVLVAGEEALGEDGRRELSAYRRAGGRVADDLAAALDSAHVAVDCLLGTGARGEPRPPFDAAVAALNRGAAVVVACDLPTGVDAVTGAVPGEAVWADVTVTLGAHKRGLWLWPGRGRCGELVLGELGIRDGAEAPVAHVLEAADVAALLPAVDPEAHKRSRGVVLVVAGSRGMTGAAVLVARGAMAAGAGLVQVATEAPEQVTAAVPEAITVALDLADPDATVPRLCGLAERADAVVLGPGLGLREGTQRVVRQLVARLDRPLVLDADGLNAFRHDGDALRDHAAPLLALTPHRAELARLVATDEDDVVRRRTDLVPDRARAWDAVLVSKGPGTLIAAPDGRTWVNPTGSAALATAGSGDVLSGILGGLLAARPDPATVAAAVWLHGRAGELAGARQGARSTTAGSIADALPGALAGLA